MGGMILGLLAVPIGAGGCSSTGTSSLGPDGKRLQSMSDVDNRQEVGPIGRVREWVSGANRARIDESQVR